MDIKEKINEVVKELSSNTALLEQFKKDPVKVVEKLIGVDLPDDVVKKIVDGVKAKVTVDNIADVAGALKGLLGK